MKKMPEIANSESWANSKYYKGGFDPKMNKREAALILGSESAQLQIQRRSEKLIKR